MWLCCQGDYRSIGFVKTEAAKGCHIQDPIGEFAELNLVLLTLAIASVAIHSPEGQRDLREKFLADAPRAWREGEACLLAGLTGKMESNEFRIDNLGGKIPDSMIPQGPDLRYVLCKGSSRLLHLDRRVIGINGSYGFELSRNELDRWIIRRVLPAGTDGLARILKLDDETIQLGGRSPFATSLCRLDRLVSHPGFELTHIEEVGGVVKVEFDFSREKNVSGSEHFFSGFSRLKSGELRVDSANLWALHKSNLILLAASPAGDSSFELSSEYFYPRGQSDGNRLVLPERVVLKKTWNDPATGVPKGDVIDYACQWDLSGESLDDRRFMLTSFGLPEPPWAPQVSDHSGWWLPGIGLATVVVLCAALRAWNSRRHKEPAANSP